MAVERQTEPLSARLRRTSMSFHGRHTAEPDTALTSALLAGRLGHAGYVELVRQHYFLDDAMERVWDRLGAHPVVRRFDFPEPRRRSARSSAS
jgi:heme oxygenase